MIRWKALRTLGQQVVGVELIEEAVTNARANAAANGITNTTFHSGDLMKSFTPDFIREQGAVPDASPTPAPDSP